MSDETDETDLESRVAELEARVDALHRKVNNAQPVDESGGGADSTDIPFQGAKRDVVKRLEPGQVVTATQLREMQNNIGRQQRKKNAKVLMQSEFFEDEAIGKVRFTGIE